MTSTVADRLEAVQAGLALVPLVARHGVAGPRTVEGIVAHYGTATVLTGKVARELQPALGAEYAYGFFVDRVNGTLVVGHGGALPGGNGEFDMYLDLGYTIVVLSNYDPPAAVQVRFKLFELLTQA